MAMPKVQRTIAQRLLRPIKKPIWHAVHALAGTRMQMSTHYLDAFMFGAGFRASFRCRRRKIFTLQVKPTAAAYREWVKRNFTLRAGRPFHNLFRAQGQKGISESPDIPAVMRSQKRPRRKCR